MRTMSPTDPTRIRPFHFGLLALLLLLSPWTPTSRAATDAAAPLGPRIDAVFARWDRADSPGLVLGVSLEGKTLYEKGYGMADLEHGIRMSADTVSESGSVAKQVTAAAVTLLSVRGKLSLDDPVQKYLPEVPDFGHPMTIRMLLNHTSGLRDIHTLFWLVGRPSYTSPHENAEVLEVVSHQRDLNFVPGTEYLYSNTGYILLTLVVERVTGQPFTAYCAENIFIPHGMPHAAWRSPFTRIVPNRAAAYSVEEDGTFATDMPHSDIFGNGGVLSTVGEWLAWNESLDHATGEWGQVVKALQTPSTLSDGRTLQYGLGLAPTQYRGIEEISHGGATSGYRTFLARYPEKHLSIALLGNSGDLDAGGLVHRVVDIVLGLPPVAPPSGTDATADELDRDAGLYRNDREDAVRRFFASGGRLRLGHAPLVRQSPDTFVSGGGSSTFAFAGPQGARAQTVTVTTGTDAVVFDRVDEAGPTVAELAGYVGDYYSAELDVTVPVAVSDGKLTFRVRPEPARPAEPTFADGFIVPRMDGSLFTFTRTKEGAISGFVFTGGGGRCRRIVFNRQ